MEPLSQSTAELSAKQVGKSISAQRALESRCTVVDVRSPAEFAVGSFPQSVSAPILDDEERARVGLCYRERGRDAAIELGHSLVAGDVKRARVDAWLEALAAHPDAVVCCWRGGLRSRIVADWLAEQGTHVAVVDGGFKAMRRCAVASIERAAAERSWLVLGGRTGSGKTDLLTRSGLAWIDIEAAANHRGSSFGGLSGPQPSQVTFEHRLAMALLATNESTALVEDEGRNLGSLAIPEPVVQAMRRAPVIVLEVPRAQRVEHIVEDYVTEPMAGAEPVVALRDRYLESLSRLRKRLGDQRHRAIAAQLRDAFDAGGDHRLWIEALLVHYYDPMYDYQLDNKCDRVEFRGPAEKVVAHLRDRG